MDKTTVVHFRKEKYDIYIGRPSKWGNPYIIGKDGTREDVIKKYIVWFLNNLDLLDDIHELKGKRLGCYCSPLDCHGNVLASLVNEIED